MRQSLSSDRTSWHITFGTYGTRLHGGRRPTVDKRHNQRGTPFLPTNAARQQRARSRMNSAPRRLTQPQCELIEAELPGICDQGGWDYRIAAASSDHVHLLCDVAAEVHGEKVRRLIKRWLVQVLSERWPLVEGARWWAVEGSNIAVCDEAYLNHVYRYILRQRATFAAQVGDDWAR